MMPPRLAVFDVDGTLVDSQNSIIQSMTLAWDSLGLGRPCPQAVRRIIGLSLVDACARLLPEHDPATHEAVAVAYKDAFRVNRLEAGRPDPLFPGARAALDALEIDGWLLGIATGKTRRGLDALLEQHALTDRFVTLQTADGNPSKPDPTMLRKAALECGLPPESVAMIGDTAYDMQMASAAGTAAIGVAWGYHPTEDLRQAGATVIIDSFDHLSQALDLAIGERPCAPSPF